jgi:hypothetical protein
MELPKTVPNAHVFTSAGCTSRGDHLHFTPDGYRELGKRYGETMLSLLSINKVVRAAESKTEP